MGDYHGIPAETLAKLKIDAPVLGGGLVLSFSNLSWADWAAIGTLVYTIVMTAKLLWNWIRHGK